MTERKYQDLILRVEARSSEELKKHRKGPGTRYVFSDSKNNPKGKLYSIVRRVKDVNHPEPHIDIHTHTVDSMFMFLGDEGDLTGLEVKVILGDEEYKLQSPASVYIPAGVPHGYEFLKGSGKYINLVLAEGGDYNKFIR
jgi:2-isopropylmalate synthase